MGVEADDFRCTVRIERKVQPGAHSKLQDSTFGKPHDPLPVRRKLAVSHRQIHEMRHNSVVVEAHSCCRERSRRPTGPQSHLAAGASFVSVMDFTAVQDRTDV